jgi:methionyl-tRNA formyltransferase
MGAAMQLIMMGTGPFAVPVFQAILDVPHEVVALVTAPVRVRRGKMVQPVSSIRDIAQAHGIPVFDPEDVNTPESRHQLQQLDTDLLVVCDYGQILSAETLATARFGGVNLHGSLLPKYRGAAPINWAIYHGEPQSGVSVIHMTPKVDAGPVIAQASVPIEPEETAAELERRLAQLGAGLTLRAIDAVASGQIKALPQDPAQASRAPRLKKEHGQIDWSRSAQQIKDHVRAMEPWPKTYTYWHRAGGPTVRIILGPVEVDDRPVEAPPGRVIEATDERLIVAAGEGFVLPRSLQPAGKRLMPIAEFLRGYRVQPGDRFGPAEP